MWRRTAWCVGLIFLIPFVLGIEITEVELNPAGSDGGAEWIELFSDEEINLGNYKLKNNDGDEIILEGEVSGYYIYLLTSQWLDNKDEKVFIYKGDEKIDESDLLEDVENDDKTWQKCKDWEFMKSSQGEENDCRVNNEENIEEDEDVERVELENFVDEIITLGNKSESEEKGAIYLSPQNIKKQENKEIVFESKDEKIKKYAIYGFALFCIFIIMLLIRDRK